MEKQNPGDCHDGGAARQDTRNRRKRSAFLKKQEERDRTRTNADSGKQRIVKTGYAEFLVPASAEPENCQINQDRQCGAGFDYKSAKAFADSFSSKTCKDLMCAIKQSCQNGIPKPDSHERNNNRETGKLAIMRFWALRAAFA